MKIIGETLAKYRKESKRIKKMRNDSLQYSKIKKQENCSNPKFGFRIISEINGLLIKLVRLAASTVLIGMH